MTFGLVNALRATSEMSTLPGQVLQVKGHKRKPMNKKDTFFTTIFLITGLLIIYWGVEAAPCAGDTVTYRTCIPVIQVGDAAFRQVHTDGSDPANPYAIIRQTGPTFAGPGDEVTYHIQLANYEAVTRTFQVTETIPAGLAVITSSLPTGMTYESSTRQLTWQGLLAPAYLDYGLMPDGLTLPYIDLAAYGVPNLCDDLPDCDETAVTFNLGINNYTFPYYGQTLSEITVSPNGLMLAPTGPITDTNVNTWLPAPDPSGAVLAGLWRDVDMGGGDTAGNGRWHAAILSGLLEGQSLFYAQWHDAPHAADPDNTARHAIALPLGDGPYTGHIFYIYDNIAHPDQLVAAGYTIGLADSMGSRGLTVAFSDCCGGIPPQGYPPAGGTTIHLAPLLRYPDNAYQTTLTYTAAIQAPVPETIITTAMVTSNSPNPAVNVAWATHYLYVREMTYLPAIKGGGD